MSSAARASASATSAASISSSERLAARRSKRRACRSRAAKRLTAVGRVEASSSPRRREAFLDGRRAAAAQREGRAVGRRDADRRRAAHGHVADRQGDLGRRFEREPDFLARQQALVEQAQDASVPVERAKDLRHGPGATTRPTPRRRGSATASVLPPARNADGVDAPDLPGHRIAHADLRPVAHLLERRDPGRVEGVLLELDRVGEILLVKPRRGDRLLEGLAPHEQVEQDLKVRRRDRRAAGSCPRRRRRGPESPRRRADRGEHPLAGRHGVDLSLDEPVEVGLARPRREVVHLVVPEETEARRDAGVAERVVQRRRHGDDVSLSVRDGEVRRRGVARPRPRRAVLAGVARAGSIVAARRRARSLEVNRPWRTPPKSGSPRYRLRSKKARFSISAVRCAEAASRGGAARARGPAPAAPSRRARGPTKARPS